VDYELEDEIITGNTAPSWWPRVLIPTTWKPTGNTAYGKHPDILTSLEFERLVNASGPTGGKILRPPTASPPKPWPSSSVWVPGTRPRAMPYCSKVCCMYTAKHAILLREKVPGAKAIVFYIDVRTPGKDYEEFYNRAYEEYGATYIRGQVGKVYPDGDRLIVRGRGLLKRPAGGTGSGYGGPGGGRDRPFR
jgi:heterodisulfide reductase subunit A2